jgi:acyl carrier protein
MLTRDEIQKELSQYLEEMFEIPVEKISLEARLVEDLDLDSIDVVDLVVKLQHLTHRKLTPNEFKSVRTVNDIIDRVHAILAA